MKEWIKSFGIALLMLSGFAIYGMALMYGMKWGLPKLFQSSAWQAYVTFIDWLPKPTQEQFVIGLIIALLLMTTCIAHGMRNDPYWGNKPKSE